MEGKKIGSFPVIILLTTLLVVSVLLYSSLVTAGPYLDSAHGNTSYGVNRSSIDSLGYAKANCAHCHEKHASIGGTEPDPTGGPSKWCLLATNFSGKTTKLYSQSDSVCFYCHIVAGTYQSPAFYNYSYSITFGGNPDTTPNNIFDTFNSTSYHNLYDVYRLITGLYGSKTFPNFPADSNPCSGCHNVHIAKRSSGKPTGSYDPAISAISKPSDHSNLWGDDASERLNPNFTTKYQAPYRYGSSSAYEPDGSTTTNGSNLTDFNTFCTDCHNATNTIYSTTLGRNLKKIDWVTTGGETGGDKHGKNVATDTAAGNIHLKAPYLGVWTTAGLVLACTDCHEPHGSPNVFLLRNEINGGVLSNSITAFDPNICSQYLYSGCKVYSTDGNKVLGWLCRSCHKDDNMMAPATYPTPNTWKEVHHYGTDFPYERTRCYRCHPTSSGEPISCNCCHYHGSSTTDYGTDYPCICDPIPCDLNPPVDRKTF